MERQQPIEILKQYWGYDSFRTLQEDIISAAIAGHDVLALLPTGGGKSICFQVPALALEGLCLVVSPLIALMKDQVENLKARGISAAAIYSGMSAREVDLTLDNCIYGDIKFLYLSPERLKTDLFKERVQKMKLALFVVDEAHCISQWGYDFRPAYLEILEFKKQWPELNTMALTATATKQVQEDIQEKLGFKDGTLFRKSFARANLSYSVREVEDKKNKLLEVLTKVSGTGIVYASTRKATVDVAKWLQKNNVSADYYHGGLDHKERMLKQEGWIENKIRVMVCTNAFGMGIDKPDVRIVAHMDLPPNLESYYQEAGRAGRDERNAFAVVIYEKKDLEELLKKTSGSNPKLAFIQGVYQALANHFQLAVGSNSFKTYDFEISEFATKYQLDPIQLFHGLKVLERASIIELSEGFHHPSRVLIKFKNEELYRFQVAYPKYDSLIKGLLRLYGGELYSNFVTVSETRLAAYLETDLTEIIEGLHALSKQGVLIYSPQKDKPQIAFAQPRLDATNLQLDEAWLKQKRRQDSDRAQSVVDYIQHRHRCRTQILLEYFDEVSYDKCGVCDICLNEKQADDYTVAESYRDLVKKELDGKSKVEKSKLMKLVGGNESRLIDTLRKMQDAGEIELEGDFILRLY